MDITQILSYGAIGLSFLLAGLAYKLLTLEQRRDAPRDGSSISVRVHGVLLPALSCKRHRQVS
jgi:hypothetical protein